MIDERTAMELTGGGDTLAHYHLSDRTPTHATLHGIQAVERITEIAGTYTATEEDDYLLADTTAGTFTLTLPVARGGKIYTVLRVAGGNNLTVARTGTDTINGAASITVSTSYAPHRLKAMAGTGYFEA